MKIQEGVSMQLKRVLEELENSADKNKLDFINTIAQEIESADYTIVELNNEKPWGGYIRIANDEADKFVSEFFSGVSSEEARLGIGIDLSPKILIVTPEQRLSWQYHNRRAERWMFLAEGSYNKSHTDEQGEPVLASAGQEVQFETGERHRLNGIDGKYSLVAEIWQHTDVDNPSDEDDIIRLADDYSRT